LALNIGNSWLYPVSGRLVIMRSHNKAQPLESNKMNRSVARFRTSLACLIACLAFMGGCASTNHPRDPLEPLNRGIYTFNEAVDTTLLRPAAELYHGLVPRIVRIGVSNFFSNINDVIVALNNLLQGKVSNAASDTGRVLVNTTIGLLGIFDVATPMGMPKNNEDFGQTLGWWGVGDGPYLVLPIFGPSNIRDTFGLVADMFTDPTMYVDPTRTRNIMVGTRTVNRRSELLEASTVLEAAALDKYQFVRDAYLQRRRSLIYDGNPPREKDEDFDSKPRSELQVEPRASETWSGSILVSGEQPTPAQLETLEKARSHSALEQAPRSTDAASDMPVNSQQRVVRFWAPQAR
jgi:phospholipid-binding lipoprotein MlaA